MKRFLKWAVGLAMLLTGSAHAADGKVTPPDVKVTLQKLLEFWRRYDLPFPPKEAALVECPTRYRSGNGENAERTIGFLLSESDGQEKGAVILTGAEHYVLDPKVPAAEAIRPLSREDALKVMPHLMGTVGIGDSNHLPGTAVQCLALGWDDVAAALLTRSSELTGAHSRSAVGTFEGEDPQMVLIKYTWAHAQSMALHPTADRRPAAILMRKLVDDGHDLEREAGTWLCHGLEAALQPGKGKPGTPLALIDRLVDSTMNGGTMAFREAADDDPYHHLTLMGFEAVPDLINHLDDGRLTRSVTQGFNNFPSWPRQVGDIASELLQKLAGDEMGTDWLQRQQGARVAKEAALAWWKEAQAVGEETYLTTHVYPKANGTWPNSMHLKILAKRYPSRVPEVYRAILADFPTAQSHPVATALKDADLPRETKVAAFQAAITHANWDTRYPAMSALRELDSAVYSRTLKDWLSDWPTDSEGPYWTCREARISHLVLRTSDPEVWDLFLKVVKAATTGLRMELLNPFSYTVYDDASMPLRLQILLEFLGEETLRIAEGEKYDGPCAGFTQRKLRVCDFVAEKVASILEIDPDEWPKQEWSEGRRTELRQLAEVRIKQP